MVSELARRAEVPATTLRFYEQEGLLPAQRSSGGYRLYDESAVDRLAFITTAKSLGLPLSEIRRLLEPWEHGVCAQVQRDLDPLLARRIVETGQRIIELQAFAHRLEQARAQLAAIDRDGPCDPSCVFLGQSPQPPRTTLTAIPQPDPAESAAAFAVGAAEPAIACTLSGTDRADRAAQWAAALAEVTAREAVAGGVRLRFGPQYARVGELAELAAAEACCCAFFDLTLRLGPAPILEVRAPDEAQGLVYELFGRPDR